MSFPQNLLPFKPELLIAYLVSLGITISNILGTMGVVIGMISSIVITISLFRMYKSQRILNETKTKVEQERLKILINKEEK